MLLSYYMEIISSVQSPHVILFCNPSITKEHITASLYLSLRCSFFEDLLNKILEEFKDRMVSKLLLFTQDRELQLNRRIASKNPLTIQYINFSTKSFTFSFTLGKSQYTGLVKIFWIQKQARDRKIPYQFFPISTKKIFLLSGKISFEKVVKRY